MIFNTVLVTTPATYYQCMIHKKWQMSLNTGSVLGLGLVIPVFNTNW